MGAGNSKLSYTLQVNLHLVFMTLLAAFRQVYVMDITLKQAIVLDVQFRGGLNPFLKGSHQIFNFVSQRGEFTIVRGAGGLRAIAVNLFFPQAC
ncbi:MAG: hypothetical protein HWQ38_30620 [Nostoc sp. NMS7]|uniref:hypothetical protein n=1 Tax=Nostoc sp. NMS7 TaxID=2815391 RepID=UPI0025DC2B6F|nr:hypothetical protein [Nostoc sp. NMS7]MBN3950586.1 hypothetical protein [Nostoc sp. NMS7]